MPLKRLLRKLSKPKLHNGDHGREHDSSASSWSDDSASRPGARTPAPFTAAFSANATETQGKVVYAAPTLPVGVVSPAESLSSRTQYHLPRPRIESLQVNWEEQQMEADRVAPLAQSGYANANATASIPPRVVTFPTPLPAPTPTPHIEILASPEDEFARPPPPPKPKTAGLLNADSAKMLVSVNRSLDTDKERKKGFLERLEDGAFDAEEAVGSADASGIIGVAKGIVTSDVVKTVGSTILDHMPAIMGTLEAISKAHPFIQLAFLPFKFAYEQEKVNHDNQKLRISVFESIRDTMLVIVEVDNMGDSIKQSCVGPDGEHYKSRLAEVCRGIGKEIEAAYNVLDAMQKQGKIVKFLNANAWHDKLALAKANFATWKRDLGLALQLKTAASVGNMEQMMKTFMEEFKAYRTVQELRMEQLMTTNGWRAKDAQENKNMCEQLLAIERDDADAVGHAITGKESGKQDRVAELRRQLRADVGKVVQDNLKDFAKLLSFKLSELERELKEDMRKGFEMIEAAIQGPARRVGDKMMRHIWMDQGFRGSVETRILVHAIRDYLAEQCEPAPNLQSLAPTSPVVSGSVPPPVLEEDRWVLDHLQVQRLQRLHEILDPDASGRSSIAEVNVFVRNMHATWTLPRWISYWAIGWQIYATRYCTNIDETFNQMQLIRAEVGLRMPGNRRAIDNYLSSVWPIVTGLTSGVNRFEGPAALADKFEDYIAAQEDRFRKALDSFHYDIDAVDTVKAIAGDQPAEQWILMVLSIVLRRHLEKMHLCLRLEMNDEELEDDTMTVRLITEVAWLRYKDLLEHYEHQQMSNIKQCFEWFSCGIFKLYHEWSEWSDDEHYKAKPVVFYSTLSTVTALDDDTLKGILIHPPGIQPGPDFEEGSIVSFYYSPVTITSSNDLLMKQLEMADDDKETPANKESESSASVHDADDGGPSTELTAVCESLSGEWHGFFTDKDARPVGGMFSLTLRAEPLPGSSKKIILEGGGPSVGDFFVSDIPQSGVVNDDVSVQCSDDGTSADFSFWLLFESDGWDFRATLSLSLDMLTGHCGSLFGYDVYDNMVPFVAKKAPAYAMCHRPLSITSAISGRDAWRFAYDAVVDRLRRERLTKTYVVQRMGLVTRCLELLRTCNGDEDREELAQLRRTFTASEFMEVYKLSKWYSYASDPHARGVPCDNCGFSIRRSRVLCFDCDGKLKSTRSFEFDAKEECVRSSVDMKIDGELDPHLPSHLMVKLRQRLLLQDYPGVKSRASNRREVSNDLWRDPTSEELVAEGTAETKDAGKERAAEALDAGDENRSETPEAPNQADADVESSTSDSSDEEEAPAFKCLVCKERVTKPCWYCIDCISNDAWVCSSCEVKVEELYPWEYVRRMREDVGYVQEPPLPRTVPDNSETAAGADRYAGKQLSARFDIARHSVLHVLLRFGNGDAALSEADENKEKTLVPDAGGDTDAAGDPVERFRAEMKAEVARMQERLKEQVNGVEKQVGEVGKQLERMETLLTALLERIK